MTYSYIDCPNCKGDGSLRVTSIKPFIKNGKIDITSMLLYSLDAECDECGYHIEDENLSNFIDSLE